MDEELVLTEDMEELDISDDLEMEEILKGTGGQFYQYPTVCVTRDHIGFSVKALPYVKDIKAIVYKLTTDYLIIEPTSSSGRNSFRLWWSNPRGYQYGRGNFLVGTFPTQLKGRLHTGAYRLYKYKDGFAIKRYEPIIDRSLSK